MRIVRFGSGRFGVLGEDGVHDLVPLIPEWSEATGGAAFNLFIQRFHILRPRIEGLLQADPDYSRERAGLLAPVAPRHLFAAPRNFKAHQDEMKGHLTLGGGSPADLGFFLKAVGCISGPKDPIELPPRAGRRFDYEGEVAVVIASEARGITASEAPAHVFGYTILVDMSMRMTETEREERVFRKSFHSFAPVGPWIVTADEISDESEMRIRLWVNGDLRQDATLRDLIVGIPDLIAQASGVLPLQPGDVYATGTPAGVGPVEPGDTLTVEVSGIGRMDLEVSARPW